MTINKIDNGSAGIMLEVSTDALQVVIVRTDPDGANEFNYQWQARAVGNASWTDVSTATRYVVPADTPASTRYLMQMTYTDNQGYTTSKLSEILRTDIDDDDDGLIDIYYLEDLDAMRYRLDGSGYTASSDASKLIRGCRADICSGYELRRSLDFTVAENYLDATANQDNWTVDDYTMSNDAGWLPIGNSEAAAFASVFKGNNFMIANLQINRNSAHSIALFGFISDTSEIREVGLSDIRIEGPGNVASLVGNSRGKIINSYAIGGSVTADMDSVGGLVAIISGDNNDNGTIINSYTNVTVESNGGAAGGLVGRAMSDADIVNSFASGDVGSPCEAGGLVAQHLDNSRIVNSYAGGVVESNGELVGCNNLIGGLVATNDNGIIQNSYAASTVSSDHINKGNNSIITENDNIGGLVARNTGIITASYWDSTVNPDADNGYGSSRTTVALQTPVVAGIIPTEVYYGWNSADWDFGDAQSYPALRHTAGNVEACDLDPETEIPPCSSLLAAQRNNGLSALFLLSNKEVLDNNIVFGDTPFSSSLFNYDVVVASAVDAIQLNPYAINPNTATITIKKHGDNTDTNYFADKHSGELSAPILLNEINTTITIVVKDSAITTYTLAINKLEPLVATINADDTANEGDTLSLVARVEGGSGNYRYEWTQIPTQPTLLTESNTVVPSVRIPEDLIERNATTLSVTFTVTVKDGLSTTSQSKTVTINKIDNGSADIMLEVSTEVLQVMLVGTDPDGANAFNYQWQAREVGNANWMDVSTATRYVVAADMPVSTRYRMQMTYTDNQGYTTSKLSAALRTDIDDDDDGLIDIYYLEDLDAMRYRLDGSGYTANADATKIARGCPTDICSGYELRRSLDFEIAENYLDATANQDNWTVDDYTTSTDVGWLPIGNSETNAFAGVFKGNDFMIANLQINRNSTSHIALFGFISDTSEIRDIGLSDVRIEGSGNVASLVADSRGKIINSYANVGSVTADTDNVGGLVAITGGDRDDNGIVVNSYTNIGVESNGGAAGGLVGRATSSASIVNSFALGDVGSPCEAGGLVGQHLDNSRIVNSYAGGIVESNDELKRCDNLVGGLVAINDAGTIQNSYAAATVSSNHADTESDSIGGLVARNTGIITASYWDSTISPNADNGYGSSRTTVALQTPTVAGTTLTDVYYGWDSVDWDFGDAQSYPTVRYTAGNVEACDLDPNTAIPPCRGLLPAQRNNGLSTLFLLSDGEVLDNDKTFGDTPFSSVVFNYDLTVVSEVDAIQLNPYAINPNTATITIKKHGDNTDTNYFADKHSGELSASILLNEIGTTITIVVKDSVAATYVLAINRLKPLIATINADDTANEGDTLAIVAQVEGGSGNYRYEWTQMPTHPTLLSDANIAAPNARIPENLIARSATTRSFTFTVIIGDGFSETSQSKTVMINKIDNGSNDITVAVSTKLLQVMLIGTDPEGANAFNYQWQAREVGNASWTDVSTATRYAVPTDMPVSTRYRMQMTYTDNQGYTTSKLSEAIRTDIDDDDDGLIDIYYLEDLDAMRYRLDGSGYTANNDASKLIRGCRADICAGYELRRSLDFEIAENYLDATANQDNWTVDDYTTSTDVGWLPIGNSAATAFTSVFKGNNYTIANLQINRDLASHIALFGFISDTSEIRDISLSGVRIEGLGNVAGLVADSRGKIINSYASDGSVTADTDNVGGLVAITGGDNDDNGIVVNSYTNIGVESNGGVAGGLVGRATSNASIVNSFSLGDVGGPCEAGGLVGQNLDNSRIVNSYARGVVESNDELKRCDNRIGGLVATNDNGTIQNSYAAATVSSNHNNSESDSIGGLVARNTGTITASYWDSTINPDADNGYGFSRATVALQKPTVAGTAPTNIYYGWDSADWDFGDAQSYPALRYTAGNVEACDLDPNTELPPCSGLLPAQRDNGLSALFLLSDNEVLDNNIAFGDTPFSSSVFDYDVAVVSGTDEIQLNPYAINPNTATITIKKHGDDTDTNYFADKHSGELSEPILLNEIDTTLTIVVKDFAAATYTLAINKLKPLVVTINADDTANEGDALSLVAQVEGGSGDYRYEWMQIPTQPTLLSDANIAAPNVRIPDNLMKRSATMRRVTFVVIVGDGFSTTSQSKTVTINKVDNGSTDISLEVSTGLMQVMLVGIDPDGANQFNYQWQALGVGATSWTDVSTKTSYAVPVNIPAGTRYRMQMTYTDNQGYTTLKVSQAVSMDIDDDDDGLIDIYYLEDLDAMRYSLDGSGYTASADATKVVRGCPADVCSGYELKRPLDFIAAESYMDATANRDNWTVDDYTTSTDVGWLPIGNTADDAFAGVFKGNNYTIANLQINRNSTSHVALFGFISDTSEIRDVGLSGVRIEGLGNVASLVADSRGKIINSYASVGSVTADTDNVGGLAAIVKGDNTDGGIVAIGFPGIDLGPLPVIPLIENNGIIVNSYTNVSVASNGGVAGGLVGRVTSGTSIVNSFVLGDVRSSCEAGGLVGQHLDNSEIVNSYARGVVENNGELESCNNRIGGLVATNDNGTIQNSYAAATVSSNHINAENDSIGGLVARNTGTIIASYWDSTINPDADNGYGSSRTTVALQTPTVAGTTPTDVYYDWGSADWDFGDAQSYPALRYTAGNVDACDLDPDTEILPCSGLLPAQRNNGLSILFLLSDNAVLDNNIVFGDKPFSSAVFNYDVIVASEVDEIQLNPYALNPNTATITIKKHGDNTDTNYFAAKRSGELSAPILLNEINTTLTIVVTDPTTATYTLAINKLDPLVATINADDTANEGDTLPLVAEVAGGSGNYRYEWAQIPTNPTLLSDANIASPNARIPEDLIERSTTTLSVRFTVTVKDGFSETSQSKTVTINKIDNGSTDIRLEVSTELLQVVIVETDSDGASEFDYQWQAREVGNANWTDVSTAARYIVPQGTPAGTRYRVAITNTDGQGYTSEGISEILRTDIDDDNDGLIDIYYLEDLDAMRYSLNGSGYAESADATKLGRGCPADVCSGYELRRSLDFTVAENYLDATANRDNWTVDDYTTSTDVGWLPIGTTEADPFSGVFQGNNHIIANLQINRDLAHYIALFGFTSDTSEIRDIGLLNVRIEGRGNVAGLVAESRGKIINSYATVGSVTADTDSVGGLAAIVSGGNNDNGIVINSYTNVSVESNGGVAGGLVGRATSAADIVNSFAIVNIRSPCAAGGLVGQHIGNSRIVNSYARGIVESNDELEYCDNLIGGLVAINDNGIIQNSYAASRVLNNHADTENDGIGGLVARNTGTITASYWDNTINPDADNGYGSSRTTVALQTPTGAGTIATAVYYGWDSADWDFGDAQSYPTVRYTAGNVNACDLKLATTLPHCSSLLPNQHDKGLRALEILSGGEVLNNNLIFDKPFSPLVYDYLVTIPYTNEIQLNPYAVSPTTTAITIRKSGEETDYFEGKHSGELSEAIPITDTITTLTIVVTDVATTTYTMVLNRLPVLISGEIGVSPVAMSSINDDGSVNEGNTIMLSADVTGGLGYTWMQTPMNALEVLQQSTSAISVFIPADFVNADASTTNVTFTLTVEDAFFATQRSKTVTIRKINNGDLDIMLDISNSTLSIRSTGSDPDGAGEFNYQWQALAADAPRWTDISTANSYIVPTGTAGDTRYRVRVAYTDGQGYITDYAKLKSFILEPLRTDIDDDNDGLIDIYYLEDLDAMRHSLDGSGYKTSATAIGTTMGCPDDMCSGYELRRDLDFNDDNSYISTSGKVLWTTGAGWQPIGDFDNPFTAIFATDEANNTSLTIANLRIYRPNEDNIGLFGAITGRIFGIHLRTVDVTGRFAVGGLAGLTNDASLLYHCSSEGRVTGSDAWVGGLIGSHFGSIVNSYAKGRVTGHTSTGGLTGYAFGPIADSYAHSHVIGKAFSGGLVGYNHHRPELNNGGSIANSYASGSVQSVFHVGGLVGYNDQGTITDTYATASVIGNANVGGLVGYNDNGTIAKGYAVGNITAANDGGGLVGFNDGGTITHSYWNTDTAGVNTSAGGTSKTTVQLQSSTATQTIYTNWSTDNWNFGTMNEYPSLKYAACGETQSIGGYSVDLPPCETKLPEQNYEGRIHTLALRNLTLSAGTLEPPFDPTKTYYEILDIADEQTEVTVAAAANSANAQIAVNSQSGSQATIRLENVGTTIENGINIVLTATGQTTKQYTIVLPAQPRLTEPPNSPCETKDIDRDDDGLIEICDIEGLYAIRYQLTEMPTTCGADNMESCRGYELETNLDFNTDDSYRSATTNKTLWSDGRGWRPIGTYASPFNATFVANGHTISNMTINRPDSDYVGLFGYTSDAAEINRVGLVAANVRGRFLVGALVGRNNGGAINNSYANGVVAAHDIWVGGLVGDSTGLINNSYTDGTVSGHRTVGGLVGYLRDGGTIINSRAAGRATGRSFIGGFIGHNKGYISNNYATSDIGGSLFYAGGLVSLNVGSIASSYASGDVRGHFIVGGLAADNRGTIANSYAIGTIDGYRFVGQLAGNNSGQIITSYADTGDFNLVGLSFGDAAEIKDSRVVSFADLRTPTGVGTTQTDIYYRWNSENWYFGSSKQYPTLKYTRGNDPQNPACGTSSADEELPNCASLLGEQYPVLDSLAIEASNNGIDFRQIKLSPIFESGIFNYLAELGKDPQVIKLTPTVGNSSDTISYKIGETDTFEDLANGASIEHELAADITTIVIRVTPQGTTSADPNLRIGEYTVEVSRLIFVNIRVFLEGYLQ